MVTPLVEALLLRVVRRRGAAVPLPRPTRLAGRPHPADSVACVAERTSALVLRPGAGLQVLPPGSLVLPALLGRDLGSYVVLTHDPVDVWLRVGPFETLDGRVVQQVELHLAIALADSPSRLRDLAEECGATDVDGLGRLGDVILDRLGREVTARTTEALRRRTLAELTGLSLGVLLDGALPTVFLAGRVERSGLEVVDVDWPTEGRGWTAAALTRPPFTTVVLPGSPAP